MKDIKVAVIQASPVLFNKNKTIEKTKIYIEEAVQAGAKLILFPEAYIGDYPNGLSFGTVVGSRTDEGREMWLKYYNNAIDVPGKETGLFAEWAKEYGIYLNIGVIERDNGTLYCTLLYFTPDGKLAGKHRKIKPTAMERIIWGEGDKSTLTVIDTDAGKIGGLICWENYMPQARMEIYKQNVEIYLAPTADSRERWQSGMIHIASEGRCYVLGCNQFVTKQMYPKEFQKYLENQPETLSRGGSVIVSPMGEVLAGPLFDQEGILYAELSAEDLIKSKFDFDVNGHYSRPDIFNEN
ncbi:MAG: carbon-nitrogen hydrolase family protein [Bacteroidales bacterium]|nr:carbon-nitrogen hydrolase family protein [Bacteroidales bacterium]